MEYKKENRKRWRVELWRCISRTMVQNGNKSKNSHLIIHFPTSLRMSEWASKWVSAVKRTSKVSSAEQANEWAVRANERTDERVTQYLRPESWLFCPIVWWSWWDCHPCCCTAFYLLSLLDWRMRLWRDWETFLPSRCRPLLPAESMKIQQSIDEIL